ncbi:UNVERIFIED_CONTAM: hypothetical protein GTU68_061602 [Idotea baltica]|nr:hypothetical protein [Idotea baltica]
MVHLDKIYTKSGDAGETGLGDGSRVPKTHVRVRAYGGVDELNCVLGVAVTSGLPDDIQKQLQHIQNDLFDLGADLCVPESDQPLEYVPLRVTSSQVTQLEQWIDAANEHLQPLDSFILPGGSTASAHLHLARAVCRRTEIGVLELAAAETINNQTTIYLNRLSDLLFVLARCCNDNGKSDVLWTPGESQK